MLRRTLRLSLVIFTTIFVSSCGSNDPQVNQPGGGGNNQGISPDLATSVQNLVTQIKAAPAADKNSFQSWLKISSERLAKISPSPNAEIEVYDPFFYATPVSYSFDEGRQYFENFTNVKKDWPKIKLSLLCFAAFALKEEGSSENIWKSHSSSEKSKAARNVIEAALKGGANPNRQCKEESTYDYSTHDDVKYPINILPFVIRDRDVKLLTLALEKGSSVVYSSKDGNSVSPLYYVFQYQDELIALGGESQSNIGFKVDEKSLEHRKIAEEVFAIAKSLVQKGARPSSLDADTSSRLIKLAYIFGMSDELAFSLSLALNNPNRSGLSDLMIQLLEDRSQALIELEGALNLVTIDSAKLPEAKVEVARGFVRREVKPLGKLALQNPELAEKIFDVWSKKLSFMQEDLNTMAFTAVDFVYDDTEYSTVAFLKMLSKYGANFSSANQTGRNVYQVLELMSRDSYYGKYYKFVLSELGVVVQNTIEANNDLLGRELIAAVNANSCEQVNRILLKMKELQSTKDLLNRRNENDETALMLAARAGNECIVEALAKAGADLNLKNNYGDTALHLAAQMKHQDIVYFLSKNGADLRIIGSRGYSGEDYVGLNFVTNSFQRGQTFSGYFRAGGEMTSSMYAAYVESLGEVNVSDINEISDGWTALTRAAEEGYYETVKILLRNKANPNIANAKGETPLMIAVKRKDAAVFDLLIQGGARPDVEQNGIATTLMIAVTTDQDAIAETLIELGADPDRVDANGNTALHFAAWRGKVSVVKAILAKSKTVATIQNAKGEIAPVKELLELHKTRPLQLFGWAAKPEAHIEPTN